MPIIPAASTAVRIERNFGLNPLNKIALPLNNSTFTAGCYGGTSAVPTTNVDYTVVGGDIMLVVTGGTVTEVQVKDGAGTLMTGGVANLQGRYIPNGMRFRIIYTVAPTIGVYAI